MSESQSQKILLFRCNASSRRPRIPLRWQTSYEQMSVLYTCVLISVGINPKKTTNQKHLSRRRATSVVPSWDKVKVKATPSAAAPHGTARTYTTRNNQSNRPRNSLHYRLNGGGNLFAHPSSPASSPSSTLALFPNTVPSPASPFPPSSSSPSPSPLSPLPLCGVSSLPLSTLPA